MSFLRVPKPCIHRLIEPSIVYFPHLLLSPFSLLPLSFPFSVMSSRTIYYFVSSLPLAVEYIRGIAF